MLSEDKERSLEPVEDSAVAAVVVAAGAEVAIAVVASEVAAAPLDAPVLTEPVPSYVNWML